MSVILFCGGSVFDRCYVPKYSEGLDYLFIRRKIGIDLYTSLGNILSSRVVKELYESNSEHFLIPKKRLYYARADVLFPLRLFMVDGNEYFLSVFLFYNYLKPLNKGLEDIVSIVDYIKDIGIPFMGKVESRLVYAYSELYGGKKV